MWLIKTHPYVFTLEKLFDAHFYCNYQDFYYYIRVGELIHILKAWSSVSHGLFAYFFS